MWSRPVAPLVDMLATLPAGMPVVMGKSRVRGVPAVLGQFPASCMSAAISTPGEGQIKGLLTIAANPALRDPESAQPAPATPLPDGSGGTKPRRDGNRCVSAERAGGT